MTNTVDFETFQAVHRTLLDYCRFVDEGRADDFAALYTHDCVTEEGRKPIHGPAEMKKRVEGVIARYKATSHHLSNVEITRIDATRVAATSYVYAWHEPLEGDDLHVWGRYTDELRLENNRWLIARRRFEAQGIRGLATDPGFARVPRRV